MLEKTNPILQMKFGVTQRFPCNYLQGEEEQLLVCMSPSEELPQVYGNLLNNGFRRSGEQLYRPHCAHCNACQSIRIMVNEFTYSRSQKRILQKNKSLTLHERHDERDDYYPLYESYINQMHADGTMFPANYEQYANFVRCQWQQPIFLEARDEGKLVAVAVTDQVEHGLSALYTFYSPDYQARSLGSFMILKQVALTKDKNLPFLYLGYQIDECRKMNYKQKFKPHQRLVNHKWLIYR
ncbi:arginyltransferase [Agaribacter flavus]|uniref:Aspartate/glutamate leucyltransferase n=1 Tax=Agaribacter flavus TaxID=1902781 RepID=A0ABV7FK51_9ALTE